ncbi:hypothetical protein AB0940_24775 [Streptomyces sp. NPDC006656]|uniref:hypothetical protein n=1 Tax=Streptomyces sp. NPDC006656 TaxID=3156899 RepID=UPI0034521119
MSAEHVRAEDLNRLLVRTPQQELQRWRALVQLEPIADLFAGAARECRSASGVGEARLSRRAGTA